MAILIPNFCIAIKDAESCNTAIHLAEKIQSYFRSKVLTYSIGNKGGLPATFKNEELASVKDIDKHFKDSECDLLILPIANDSGKGLVTVAEANKLIDRIERMVLTVPASLNSLTISRIVVPIDSSFETRQKVPYAISMAKAFGATLQVLGVSNDKGKDSEVLIKNYIRQVCSNIEEKGVLCTSEIRLGGNPTQVVLDYAKEINAGMIVIMTEQETNFTSFFSGKYSQQMVKGANLPVLSIHPKDLILSEARL